MNAGRSLLGGVLLLAGLPVDARRPTPVKTIVLIGGANIHNPNVHDARRAIERLRDALTSSPDIDHRRILVRAFADGWPADPRALAGASTIVWYFDGLDAHPLLDGDRRASFARAIAHGVGLVSFHQSFTLPPADRAVPLANWLGAVRYGMVDRTVESAGFTLARHPITSGVRPFACRDEFYPSLAFAPQGVVPILTADLHTEAAPAAVPTRRTVAWAFARAGGGRSFGYSGFHFLDTLDAAEPRRLMLNAILWTAGLAVPARGVRSTVTWERTATNEEDNRCTAP